MPTSLRTGYRYSHTIGFYAQVGRGFNNPVDVAVGRNGVLYVLNRAGADTEIRMIYKRVTICTVHEDYRGEFSSGGSDDGQIMWPVAVAMDEEERLYVSDEALHRISIFSQDGQFLKKWGAHGRGVGEFDRPAGIAFDGEGHVLVVDGNNNRVQRYTKDGHFVSAWGRGGHAPGEFNMPWGIAVDQVGDVYVADWRNDRVQKFDAQGMFMASFGTPGQGERELRRPSGVAVAPDGTMYVADWGNERVQVLAPDGSWLATLRGAAGLSKWAESYFVANPDELEERRKADLEPALQLDPEDERREESANIEKLFWGPVSVKLDAQGRLYVVESCRHRIQVYCREADRS